jgi:putative transposase
MCRVLGVSASGYYAWRRRGPSKRARSGAQLKPLIRQMHEGSRGSYGVPRMVEELRDEHGYEVNHKRVERLMSELGLQGVSRRKGTRTTRQDRDQPAASDLVQREFTAVEPNRLWVADITYIPTWEGFLFLAIVLDAFSRRVVGWAMAAHLRTELVLQALQMALWQRRPQDVIHHSDRGSQYTSVAFGRRCEEAGVRPSMGSTGDCFDNALAEAFFASLECELIDRHCFPTRAVAQHEVFDWIEGWYNPWRRHSALGQKSPMNYERLHAGQAAARRA